MKRTAKLAILILCVTMAASIVYAGSLNPPAPPTAGTMKPLDQVEPRTPITSVPYTISASGSYYLTKNLTATGTGITIQADNVTLDLCGFTLTGPNAVMYYGVEMNNRKNIEIRNGTITRFQNGIHDLSITSQNYHIFKIRAVGNKSRGIYLQGTSNSIIGCTVADNGTDGINTRAGALVKDNVVYNNLGYGIYAGEGSIIQSNTVYKNAHNGIWGYTACTIEGNTVYKNLNGIYAHESCVIKNNVSRENTQSGIYTGDGNTVCNNTVTNNGSQGIFATSGSGIIENTVRGNAGGGISTLTFCQIVNNTVNSNLNYGVIAGSYSALRANTVGSNSADGINAGDHVTITDNTVTSNGGAGITCVGGYIAQNTVSLNNTSAAIGSGGIVVANHSQIKDNTLEGNLKNNIYVTGFRNSVEGNVMSGSDYGINFTGSGNVYLNNRASANGTNYNAGSNTNGGDNISF